MEVLNFVDVYVSPIPTSVNFTPLIPKEREQEIKSLSNERVKREKYYAWKLLEYALKNALGVNVADAKIYKSKNGKWKSEFCEFSISHSGSCVAVAVSHAPVGIDIEPLGASRRAGFAEKLLSEDEFLRYSALSDAEKNDFLLTRWCIKEAIFKKGAGAVFVPSKTVEDNEYLFEKRFFLEGKEYFCAVSAKKEHCVRNFEIVAL